MLSGVVHFCRTSEEKTEAHTELPSTVQGSLVYEEIGDTKSSFTYTQNILYGLSSTTVRLTSDPVPEVPTGALPSEQHDQGHNYEIIQTAEYQSIDDACKLKRCSAYGVASSVDRSCDPSPIHIGSCNPGRLYKSDESQPSQELRDLSRSCNLGQEENCSAAGEVM